ncbi:MAG: hypothetical protein ACIAQZ_10300 [Sedimentisphaeraceae bacterium JB056]
MLLLVIGLLNGHVFGGQNDSKTESSKGSYEQRMEQLIGDELSGTVQTIEQDVYGKGAAMRIIAGQDLDKANEVLLSVASWFDRPHPHGRMLDGEPDFAAALLCRVYYLTHESKNLYPETKTAIENFFTEYDYKSIFPSENHYLLFRSSRYLMASILGDPSKGGVFRVRFNAYRDEAIALKIKDEYWLKDFLTFRAEKGWGEFDSTVYMIADWECLVNLYDYAPSSEIRQLAKANMDLILLGLALNSVDGIYGGAHGRSSIKSSFDHRRSNAYALNYLYFGNCMPKGMRCAVVYGSEYRAPELLVEFANSKRPAYVNRERKHLHNVVDARPYKPLDGSIRKYTYVSPGYVMGCVQFQDEYPKGHECAWYANHQQQHWDLSFTGGGTSLRVFANHPSHASDQNMGNYWAGSTGHFFQQENVLVALYEIPKEMHYQMIHAYFPRKLFDEVVEKKGWLFGRFADSAVALKFSAPYHWVEDGKYAGLEVVSNGNKHALICETRALDDMTFNGFIDEVLKNTISFNAESMELTYRSKAEGTLSINTKGKRELNGKALDLDYPSFASPYAYSSWGSGKVKFDFNGKNVMLGIKGE